MYISLGIILSALGVMIKKANTTILTSSLFTYCSIISRYIPILSPIYLHSIAILGPGVGMSQLSGVAARTDVDALQL